jgi:hypothetical protein
MFKKVIGLAALAGVSLMVTGIGCTVTSTTTNPTDGGPTADATATATTPTPTDGGRPDSAKPPVKTCEQDITGKASEVRAAVNAPEPNGYGTYKSTPAPAGQCTAQNLTDFEAYLKALPSGATYADVIAKLKTISPSCGDCTFKASTGATWGPFVTVQTSSGLGAFSNVAGCYEAQGVSKACAESLFVFDKCSSVSCSKCAEGAEADNCETDTYAQGGQCATEFGPDLAAKCGKDPRFEAAGKICEEAGKVTIIAYMNGACGGAPSGDAGGGG